MRALRIGPVLVAGWLASSAAGQQPAPPRCDAAEHDQFDFWVGEWEVRDTADAVVGHNRVTRILDGCVLLEEWTSAGSSEGKSFNIYDRRTGMWHQTWVDNNGLRLDLSGGLEDGRMVLKGETQSPEGAALHRITFTPRDGTVRQLWESSQDGGTTWTVLFDGSYSRPGG
jgi:hypothetical protein